MVAGSSGGMDSRRGGGVVLCLMNGVEYLKLAAGNGMVKGPWIRIKEQTKKADVIVGVHCRPLTQDDDTDCPLRS